MIVRQTTQEEALRVNELFAIAFEQPLQNCPADPENDKAVHWAAYTDDGEMMSTVTISDFQIHFDGNTCRMGGVGGVDTLPQYRRTGGIRGCFQAALPDMYARGYDFAYLFPFSTAYYRKFGFECCVQKYGWKVNPSLLPAGKQEGFFRLAESRCPMTDAIRALDQLWERRYNMMVQHVPEDYGWTQKFNPAATQEFTYVCFDKEGHPNAYTTFRCVSESDGRNLVCSRFCFGDKAGFLTLMDLFKSLATDHAYVRFQTPAIPALQYLIREWSLGAVSWELLASSGMVRVINVRRVLQCCRYIGSGRVTLQISDEQIPENNGCFAVEFAGGKAISVERSEAAPDIVMSIPAFSALIAGVSDFADARETFSGLEVKQENPCLDQVFYRKSMMIVDFF